jgi:hypothetical protein
LVRICINEIDRLRVKDLKHKQLLVVFLYLINHKGCGRSTYAKGTKMAFVQINFGNFKVAPLTLDGVQVIQNQRVDVGGQPMVCDWKDHTFTHKAGTFTSQGQLANFYTITQADDTGLRFTPNAGGSPVTYRP